MKNINIVAPMNFFQMAIKILEQESVLGKIRAEILEYIDDLDIAAEICDIFDKYNAEGEEI